MNCVESESTIVNLMKHAKTSVVYQSIVSAVTSHASQLR